MTEEPGVYLYSECDYQGSVFHLPSSDDKAYALEATGLGRIASIRVVDADPNGQVQAFLYFHRPETGSLEGAEGEDWAVCTADTADLGEDGERTQYVEAKVAERRPRNLNVGATSGGLEMLVKLSLTIEVVDKATSETIHMLSTDPTKYP
ncbi:hypothetical protein AB0I00_29855 [Streptomyces sp. NPDC050803]|uniref:hypothetical protein n=1 Tax=unclassified Streptomyces TaxID=2593676 RepID=UPI0034467DFA